MTVSDSPPRNSPRSGGINLTARGTGAWLLALRDRQPWGAGWVQGLEVEILFPVAQSSMVVPPEPAFGPPTGAAALALRRRRGRVRRAELVIDAATLNKALSAPPSRAAQRCPPFDFIHVRIEGGDFPSLFLMFRLAGGRATGAAFDVAQTGEARQPLYGTARIAVRRPPTGFHDILFGVSEVLLYGPCRTPAPVIAHALLQRLATALLAHPPPDWPPVALANGPSAHGLHAWSTPGFSELRLEVLHDALLDTLPRHGYRAADPMTSPLYELSTEQGRLTLRYAAESARGLSYNDSDERPRSNPLIDSAAVVLGAPLPEVIRIADQLAYGGDITAALATYRMAEGSPMLSTLSRTRRLQILTSAPPSPVGSAGAQAALMNTELTQGQAWALAQTLHSEAHQVATPLICLAALATEAGLHDQAAAHYRAIVAHADQHPIVRAMASYAAARQLWQVDPLAAGNAAVDAEALLTPVGLDDDVRALLRGLAEDGGGRVRASTRTAIPVVTAPAAGTTADASTDGTAGGNRVADARPSESRDALMRRLLAAGADEKSAVLAEALTHYPQDPELLLWALQHEPLVHAHARIVAVEDALSTVPPETVRSDGWVKLLLHAAQICLGQGEIDRARALLVQAEPRVEALRMHVRIDWPELLQADAGSAADLLPVLRQLQALRAAQPDELRGLARLLTARGEYAEAIAAQREAGADPDELLAALEAAGRPSALLRAILVHADVRPEDASMLLQQAASVAEQQLGDRPRAASLWQRAAVAQGAKGAAAAGEDRDSAVAILWFHAGRLWHEVGDFERAYAALGQAVAHGGQDLPRAQLLLADLAYALRDFDPAGFYYRQALQAGQVPQGARVGVHLKLAELARRSRDAAGEEHHLGAAVEAGGGAQAWPLLADFFLRHADPSRRAAALLAWADYAPDAERPALLRQAAEIAPDLLLGRIDEELTRLHADDDAVRDRVLARVTEAGNLSERLRVLRYDVSRSQGARRRSRARSLVELALQLSDYASAVAGWLAILDALAEDAQHAHGTATTAGGEPRALLPENGVLAFLGFWRTLQRAGARLNVSADDVNRLRERVVAMGALRELLQRTDRSLALIGPDATAQPGLRALRWQGATLAELLGDPVGAARRYLQLCAGVPPDRAALARFRALSRMLVGPGATSAHAPTLLTMLDAELRRAAGAPTALALLRVAQSEVLLFLGRAMEAEAQLAAVLHQVQGCGPAHALLGMQLATAPEPETSQRGLHHLLCAAYAPDVDAAEAGECALLAADLMAAAGITDPIELSLLRPDGFAENSFADRAAAGTFVAIPADFLSTSSSDGGGLVPVPVSVSAVTTPTSGGASADPLSTSADVLPSVQGAVLPALLGPEQLLLHAAALLPGDPRPIEGLLGLSWARGQDSLALECCERLLALPTIAGDAGERARLRLEQSHILVRMGKTAEAEKALRALLVDAPASRPGLQALRQLLVASSQGLAAAHADKSAADRPADEADRVHSELRQLLLRELSLSTSPGPSGTDDPRGSAAASPSALSGRGFGDERAELWTLLGDVEARTGATGAAREAWARAGSLGAAAAYRRLADSLAQEEDFLAAADAAGRAAMLLSPAERADERGTLLLQAADWALRADDELRARDHLLEAATLGAACAGEAERQLHALDGGQEPERRRRSLERRLQHCPPGVERIELQRRLLLLCCELFDRDAMVSHAVALLRDAPSDAMALCALAEEAIERGQLDTAAERLAQVEAIPLGYPRASRLMAWLGDQYERRGQLTAARTVYEQLLASAERTVERAADASDERTGEPPDASSAGAEPTADLDAIEIALEGLARLSEESGDLASALRLLRRRLPYLPADAIAARASLRLRLCDLALAQSDLLEARTQLEAVLSEQPNSRSALVKMLEVHRRGSHRPQDIAEAMQILERLLDLAMTPGERAEWLFARGDLLERYRKDRVRARADYERAVAQWPGHARALRRLVMLAARRGDGDEVALRVAALGKAGALLGDVQTVAALALALPAAPSSSGAKVDPAARQEQARSMLHSVDAHELAVALVLLGCDVVTSEPGAGAALDPLLDLYRWQGPLQVAVRVLGGDAQSLLAALRPLLRTTLDSDGVGDSGLELSGDGDAGRDTIHLPIPTMQLTVIGAMAALCEQTLPSGGLDNLYLSTLSYIAGRGRGAAADANAHGEVDARLDDLGALPVGESKLESALRGVRPMAGELLQWQTALSLLGRYVLGLSCPPLRTSSEWGELLGELARSLGFPRLDVALVDTADLAAGDRPAVCDPTRPPRLRLLRALTQDGHDAQVRFAALRALHLLRSGVPLVLHPAIGVERVSGLLRAAIALWLEGLGGAPSARGRWPQLADLSAADQEWLSTLRALTLHPDHAAGVAYEARDEAEVLSRCFDALGHDPQALVAVWPQLFEQLQLQASVRALGQLGDLRAALHALGAGLPDRVSRLQALSYGALADFWSVAREIYGG